MSAHTPEPWIHRGDYVVYLGDKGGFSLRDCPSPDANARRIVACVNACADMSTEYLEQCGKMRRNEAGESIVDLIRQRDDERKKHEACVTINERLLSDIRILTEQCDELLAALCAILDYEDGTGKAKAEHAARAAIAKVKP